MTLWTNKDRADLDAATTMQANAFCKRLFIEHVSWR
jgi:hypothetical protein